MYRDRGDCENAFDELKNQWGWGGFTTHDLKRCRLLAGSVALIFNWWSLFVRLADPDRRPEAITSLWAAEFDDMADAVERGAEASARKEFALPL